MAFAAWHDGTCYGAGVLTEDYLASARYWLAPRAQVMADSAITLAGLAAVDGVGHVALSWTVSDPQARGTSSLKLDAVEVWAAATNDRAGAVKVAEGITSAIHTFVPGEQFFYWIRARDRYGTYGDWFPAPVSAGIGGGTALITNVYVPLLGSAFALQWGAGSTDASGIVTVGFGGLFANSAFQVVCSVANDPGANSYAAHSYDRTSGGFKIKVKNTVTGADVGLDECIVNWIAIGLAT